MYTCDKCKPFKKFGTERYENNICSVCGRRLTANKEYEMETEQNKKDIEILKALYYGNHLSDAELNRALKLICLLNVEIENRIRDFEKV